MRGKHSQPAQRRSSRRNDLCLHLTPGPDYPTQRDLELVSGNCCILSTARDTHLTQTTTRTAEQAINALMSGIAGNCGVSR